MGIVIQNDGDRVVDTIADRNAIPEEKRFPGMQVSVKDATADPQTNGGFAKYEWISAGVDSRWTLIQIDNKHSIKFTTESRVIQDGKVTMDNVAIDNSIWTVRIVDSNNGVIMGDFKPSLVENYTITLGTNAYDGQILEYSYAYGSFSVQLDSVLNEMKSKSVALDSGTINLASGDIFTKTVTADITFSVSNVEAAGYVDSFIVELVDAGSYTVTWFSGIQWESGTAPTLTEVGKDIVAFYTHDGGVTWYGVLVGNDMKPVA